MICNNLICAEKLIVDMFSRKVSFINIIDAGMGALEFPFFMPLMIYSRYQKEKAGEQMPELYLEVKLNNALLSRIKIALNFTNDDQPSRNIINAGFLQIPEPGKLIVSVINESENRKVLISDTFTLTKANIPIGAPNPSEFKFSSAENLVKSK